MVNFYLPDRLLKTSTHTAKPREIREQNSGVNVFFEAILKNKFSGTNYYLQPTSKNGFVMLFFCTIIFFALSFFSVKPAFSEEKDNITSDALRFKIIGDQEAPAVRYFVPWKSPEKDEMLPVPTPHLEPLNILDPYELRREIDYYSTLHTIRMGSETKKSEDSKSAADTPAPESTEQGSPKTMSTKSQMPE